MTTFTNIKKHSVTLGLSLLLLCLGQNSARALNLPDVPLSVFSTVENNVLLTFDDSGSMAWGFLPDGIGGNITTGTAYAGGATATTGNTADRRACSNTFNGIAYNPTADYTPPPVRTNPGNLLETTPQQNLPNANFFAAPVNGFIAGSATVNLSTIYRPVWSLNVGSNLLTANVYATCGIAAAGVPAFYYVYDGIAGAVNEGVTCPTPAVTTSNGCYRRVQHGAALYGGAWSSTGGGIANQQQNFANWYSYYRVRNIAAKSATGRAFRIFGTNVRIAGQHLNNNVANAGAGTTSRFTNVPAITAGTTNLMRRFCDDPFSNDSLCANLSTARNDFFTRLYNSPAALGTPLRAAMQRAGDSFGTANTGNNSPYRDVPGVAPTVAVPNPELSCRKNFHILMTDGYWNSDAATVANTDGAARTLGDGTTAYTPTRPYTDTWSGTLADHAFDYWARDLRPTLANNVPTYLEVGTPDPATPPSPWYAASLPWDHRNNPASWQHMQNYTIGMGIAGTLNSTNYPTALPANPGQWDDLLSGTASWPDAISFTAGQRIDDLWHAAVNSRGTYFSARDPDAMLNAFSQIINSIAASSGSAAGLGASGGSTSGGTSIFQVAYATGTWAGRLISRLVDTNGVPQAAAWEAGTAGINSQNYLTRKIITSIPTNAPGARGVPFLWANLSTTQQAALNTGPLGTPDGYGLQRVDYLRGASTFEGVPAAPTTPGFRARTCYNPATVGASTVAGTIPTTVTCPANVGKLGDIVDSSPVYVGKPDAGYPDTIESVPYSTFVKDPLGAGGSGGSTRQATVYVGANDGMLHAFRADTGVETLAYVPNLVYTNIDQKNLSLLTSTAYTHRFYVNATPTVGDVYISGAGGGWRTMLVGGLRKGGKGYYALDITNPATFTEANAAQIVQWEFPNPATPDLDMNFSYSQPAIVKMANGQWAAVFGNGYYGGTGNSPGTGRAMLYIVDIATGNLIQKIDTLAGGGGGTQAIPNGMGTPAVVDLNDDFIADYIYAGDLFGNMWRIDVRSSTPANWGTAANVLKLYTATDGATPTPAVQPITTKPAVGFHPLGYGGLMVYFGTGKFLENFDNAATGVQVTQSFYGIYDRGATGRAAEPSRREATIIGRGDLLAQTLTTEVGTITGSAGTFYRRNVSDNAINWRLDRSSTTTHLGWYVNLPENGEKQVTDPLLREGRIIFTTLSPGLDACEPSGTGWLMELDSTNGGRIDETLDLNGDSQFNASDNPGFTYGAAGAKSTAGGGLSSPTVLVDPDGPPPPGGPRYSETKLVVTSKGAVVSMKESGTPNAPEAWRQLK